jgi:hypothetical protein
MNDKQVLQKAQTFGIRHILEQKESVIPIRIEDVLYIFLSFKKKGDEGYTYFRIENANNHTIESLSLIMDFKRQMNCTDMQVHTAITNTN